MAQLEQIWLQVQQLRLLRLVAKQVNKTRNRRLNCWEGESAQIIESKQNPIFGKEVMNYYQRESSWEIVLSARF